ncbi:MAG: hypothetical protein LBR15_05965 [Methanobrevibacter sp.]|nr:hypothetical protein [Candidatus Methanovirga australis]
MFSSVIFKKVIKASLVLTILLFSSLTLISADEVNETIEVRIGDQFTINSLEHSFEFDNEYLLMVVNGNGSETFSTLKVGNTTVSHRLYPKGNYVTYNIIVRELTFTEYISKLIDDFFNIFK